MFLLVRLPEEVRRVEREVAGERLTDCCVGTPAAEAARQITATPDDLPRFAVARQKPAEELFQVAVFLASFTGLYFTVYAVTDETYRSQFFAGLSTELEQAVAVNAVYVSLPRDE